MSCISDVVTVAAGKHSNATARTTVILFQLLDKLTVNSFSKNREICVTLLTEKQKIVVRNSELDIWLSLNVSQPYGPLRSITEKALLFRLIKTF
jgi:hypothetical protein